jgi:simple sugar transport system substrate-binding protein
MRGGRALASFAAALLVGSACATSTQSPGPSQSAAAGQSETALPSLQSAAAAQSQATTAAGQFCKGMKVRGFVGGPPGDPFSTPIQHGMEQARADLGADVAILYSNWDSNTLLNQVREAIAEKPDALSINGLPGPDALRPLAKQMREAGILFNLIVVDTGSVHTAFNAGYFGVVDPYGQGQTLAQAAIGQLAIKNGDRVLAMGPWELPQHVREDGVVDAFKKVGATIDKITISGPINNDPNQLTPILTAYQLAHPDTKLWSFATSSTFGQAPAYAKAAGLQPGQVKMIGFDLSAAIIEGFDKGYVQIASDQQPYLMGYESVVSLCMSWKYGFNGVVVDTGTGLVDTNNYKTVGSLAQAGIR